MWLRFLFSSSSWSSVEVSELSNGILPIVSLGKVFHDSAGFPERDTGIRVFDGGDMAVGLSFSKGSCLIWGNWGNLVS